MMMIYVVRVRLDSGDIEFTFPMEHEANAFKQAVLLCRECVLVHRITRRFGK